MQAVERLSSLISAGEWVLLSGPPGTAKTSRIRAAAERAGRKLFLGIGGRTADMVDRLDVGGAIMPNKATGVAEVYPLSDMKEILDYQGPAVWFVDELGRAPIDTQGMYCSQFDFIRRERPNLVVVGATNRPQDKAGVTVISEQLRSRFSVAFTIATPDTADKPDGPVLLTPWNHQGMACDGCEVCGWCEWAMDDQHATGLGPIPSVVIAWHRTTNGAALYTWKPQSDPASRAADFRTWHTVGRLVARGLSDLNTIAAAIGKPAAAEFLAFAELAETIPTPEQIRIDPKGAPVPSAENASGLYLVATSLAAAANAQDAEPFCTYMGRMPRVFAALLGRDMYRRVGAALSGSKAWSEWVKANGELFGAAPRR